ncbi:hypothetical protein [Acetobacter senegalensis]|uniref:hypothetical protein n=1 Tax=Acetobacter senegalensis TaxID=446692 RepID=UPI00264C523A|nr:hypothetical protein [Acetobacter senegalensis]MDN7351730.1 hypothetical protein [Acetobacter senegalensis]
MRKFIMMLGVTTSLFGITDVVQAAPVPYHAAVAHNDSILATSSPLLSEYEQDGLVLQDEPEAETLVITADPATLHARALPSDGTNRYRIAMRDVLSAAASYAYLFFGQHPDADRLSVVANIQSDSPAPASSEGNAPEPALTFDIPRPTFPISPDSKPDAYSAQTISLIMDEIDPAKTHVASWLRADLQDQPHAANSGQN